MDNEFWVPDALLYFYPRKSGGGTFVTSKIRNDAVTGSTDEATTFFRWTTRRLGRFHGLI